jgi:bifunctional DNA-binding transcriptional regulator/antitoxin component of YhaV-PrlF toxin-antitoxin module
MATQVVLTFSDGKLAIPPEVQEQMHLTEGGKLRLTLAAEDRMVLEPAGTAGEPKELPEWKWEPNAQWRSARGMLSDHPEHDTSKARAEERAWELEHDERKFGPFPKR